MSHTVDPAVFSPTQLISLSVSDTLDTAVGEWELIAIMLLENGRANRPCLCGQKKHEICLIRNRYNEKETEVGACCFRLFEDHGFLVGVRKIFSACRGLKKEPYSSAGLALVEHGFESRILTTNERAFYSRNAGKRKLRRNQLATRTHINTKLLLGIVLSVGEMFHRIKKMPDTTTGPRLIQIASEKGVLTKEESRFYLAVWEVNPEKLTKKQVREVRDLNDRMLASSKMQHLNAAV